MVSLSVAGLPAFDHNGIMDPLIRPIEHDFRQSSHQGDSMERPVLVLAIVNAVLRARWRLLAIVALLCGLATAFTLLKRPRFVSDASFSLQGGDSKHMSGLAAQFGFALPSGDGGQQSPAYYEDLLTSREILAEAAQATYVDSTDGRAFPVTLASVYEVRDRDPALRNANVVQKLRNNITTSRSRETGVVHVSVSAPSPVLAKGILDKLLALLGQFNIKTRQSQAANERKFVEARLAETKADLNQAEDRLEAFLQSNRGGYMNVPQLSLQHQRLEREVGLRQDLFNSLTQSYEQARLDEVRDTPAITVIEKPNRPVRRAPRGLLKNLALAAILALFLGFVPLLLPILTDTGGQSPDAERREFERLRAQITFWRRRRQATP